jgi:hypothetical protein
MKPPLSLLIYGAHRQRNERTRGDETSDHVDRETGGAAPVGEAPGRDVIPLVCEPPKPVPLIEHMAD